MACVGARRSPLGLFATASLIGEGFDLPRLDTLDLSMPVSWKGWLIQNSIRLHREHETKGDALIFDYLDDNLRHHSIASRRDLGMPPGFRLARSGRKSVDYRKSSVDYQWSMETRWPVISLF
jgi:superfamily II DNA or RNA helicase